jgi:hypothetical protein
MEGARKRPTYIAPSSVSNFTGSSGSNSPSQAVVVGYVTPMVVTSPQQEAADHFDVA